MTLHLRDGRLLRRRQNWIVYWNLSLLANHGSAVKLIWATSILRSHLNVLIRWGENATAAATKSVDVLDIVTMWCHTVNFSRRFEFAGWADWRVICPSSLLGHLRLQLRIQRTSTIGSICDGGSSKGVVTKHLMGVEIVESWSLLLTSSRLIQCSFLHHSLLEMAGHASVLDQIGWKYRLSPQIARDWLRYRLVLRGVGLLPIRVRRRGIDMHKMIHQMLVHIWVML